MTHLFKSTRLKPFLKSSEAVPLVILIEMNKQHQLSREKISETLTIYICFLQISSLNFTTCWAFAQFVDTSDETLLKTLIEFSSVYLQKLKQKQEKKENHKSFENV